MSLQKSDVIDAIGTETESGSIVMSIIDSWGWDSPDDHLNALQNKLNCYFDFVESGQIFESYPEAKGRNLRIDIVEKFAPPESVEYFFERTVSVAAKLGITIKRYIV
ncbi:DUF6572 domain-containing protein [Burkholderia contaminans]|uniref:DUF6572 domain-containing protein n=1 Tax=Burkholderia contaminans TaxID=488447 RepID=UPI00158B5ADB|nr:DUF6572 domain-containing protein [Burkholderia contaminans]